MVDTTGPNERHSFVAESDPNENYDKLYVCVREDSRLDLKAKWVYTLVAGAARKSGNLNRTDAELETLTGLSIRSNRDALNTLAAAGLVVVETVALGRGKGSQRRILIPRLSEVYGPAKSAAATVRPAKNELRPANNDNRPAKSAAVYKETTDVTTDVVTDNNAPPISDQEKNGARPEGAQTKVPVSTSKHTYWTHPEWGPQREFCFTTIQGFYPRDDGEQSARHAWERRIGTRLDVPDLDQEMFWKALCYASQWYRDEVKRNATEAKYVTSFPNWLAGEKWNDAPRWVREGKAGPDAR